eukprot:NODE_9936_length_1389_cov_7.797147.p1 GENE.NODE_9936_length_1389_cov_7.797147~~NODE_9936_length_1389_cov_7.797147.p1  ORF type:complete len:374 (+),score=69.81 NODE_9936_length_1389_cov_7.797147:92-1123(+)
MEATEEAVVASPAKVGKLATDVAQEALAPEPNERAGWPTHACEGNTVILWGGHQGVRRVKLERGGRSDMKCGSFGHDSIIGMPYGARIRDRKDRWVLLLRLSPELISRSMPRLTQILYENDIDLILTLLDIRPGKVIIESGTGTGSLSVSLATALRPGGKLHTFEFHEGRHDAAVLGFADYGLSDVIVARHGSAYETGCFESAGAVDGVFFDLPQPWLAVPHIQQNLVGGGRLVSFSPCIEQVSRMAAELRRAGFHEVRMFESLPVPWGVANEKKGGEPPGKRHKGGGKGSGGDGGTVGDDINSKPQQNDRSGLPVATSFIMPVNHHTGYLLAATKPPADEPL